METKYFWDTANIFGCVKYFLDNDDTRHPSDYNNDPENIYGITAVWTQWGINIYCCLLLLETYLSLHIFQLIFPFKLSVITLTRWSVTALAKLGIEKIIKNQYVVIFIVSIYLFSWMFCWLLVVEFVNFYGLKWYLLIYSCYFKVASPNCCHVYKILLRLKLIDTVE